MESDPIEAGVARMVDESTRTSPTDVLDLLDVMCELLRAQAARFYVADYSLRRLQQIDERGPVGPPQTIAGTLIGRVFTSGEIQIVGTDPTVVLVPLAEGSSPIGVLELDFEVWDGLAPRTSRPDRRDLRDGVDRQGSLHRYSRSCSPIGTAVGRGGGAMGPATAAGLLDRTGRGRRHPRARIRHRWRLVRLCVRRVTSRLHDRRCDRPRHVGRADVGGRDQQSAQLAPRADRASPPPTTTPTARSRRSSETRTTSPASSERWTCRAAPSLGSTPVTSCRCSYATAPTPDRCCASRRDRSVSAGRSPRWPSRRSSQATECSSTPTASPRLDPRTDPSSATTDWPTSWSERRWRTCLSRRPFGTLPTASSASPSVGLRDDATMLLMEYRPPSSLTSRSQRPAISAAADRRAADDRVEDCEQPGRADLHQVRSHRLIGIDGGEGEG